MKKHEHSEECNHKHHNHDCNDCKEITNEQNNSVEKICSCDKPDMTNSESLESTDEESELSCKSCGLRFMNKLENNSHNHHNHVHEHDEHNEHENHEHKEHEHHDHENHEHHGDHSECHGHHHHKERKGILKFIYYILEILGLSSDHDHHDHSGHVGHDHSHTFTPKLWILVVATILGSISIIMMITNLFSDVFQQQGWYIFELLMGITAFIIMGLAFIKGSTISLMNKEIAEDTLVAIAATSAFCYSLFAFIFNAASPDMHLPYFFLEQVEVLWLIYLGRFIEEWLMNRVTKEMNSLQSLKPKNAIVIRDGIEKEINVEELVIGDIVIVKAGGVIPVDGTIIEGTTTVDESSLTGESMPVTKTEGSKVLGGTISANSLIKIKAIKLIGDSFISQIISSVEETMKNKPESQRMADKIAAWLVPSVLVISFVSFIITGLVFGIGGVNTPAAFNSLTGGTFNGVEWLYAFYILITVLVVACPCSFAMQTPMSILMATMVSKRDSVIFSSNTLFERIEDINVIAFDKTGTLTEGIFEVIGSTIPERYINEVISAEKASGHPLANSIVRNFSEVNVDTIEINEVLGKGIETSNIKIGSLNWLKEYHNYEEVEEVVESRKVGSAVIYVFNEEEVIGYLILRDKIKASSKKAIKQIKKMGVDVVMITGDHKHTALNIAKELGIKEENVFYEVEPSMKSEIVKGLQDKGNKVAFVGDGINDSIAITQADLGIAIGEGSDAAIEASDIVLNENDISLVAYSLWLSKTTMHTIKRGFGIAIGYNVVLVTIAATGILGLTGAGPALAAVSMVFNDSIAMINALTLNNKSKKYFDKRITVEEAPEGHLMISKSK